MGGKGMRREGETGDMGSERRERGRGRRRGWEEKERRKERERIER